MICFDLLHARPGKVNGVSAWHDLRIDTIMSYDQSTVVSRDSRCRALVTGA